MGCFLSLFMYLPLALVVLYWVIKLEIDKKMGKLSQKPLDRIHSQNALNGLPTSIHPFAAKYASLTHISAHPDQASFQEYGPSEEFLDAFTYSHPNPNNSDLLTIVETQLALQQYTNAETRLRSFILHLANDGQRMRYYNALMLLYIMTGRTEQAVTVLEECQSFADTFLAQSGKGLLQYLDNVAMICALTGDFDEADRYLQALWNVVGSDMHQDSADLYPYLTETKIMFLRGEKTDAEIHIAAAEQLFREYTYYHYPWEKDYMLTLLAQTRLFNVSLADTKRETDMPDLREM